MNTPEQLLERYTPVKLADLRLTSGTSVQVEVVKSRQRYKAEWVGYSDQALYLSAPKTAVRLMPGTELRLRLLQDNWIVAFTVKIEAHADQPSPLWILSLPETIEAVRIRSHTRFPVAMRVRVDGDDPLAGPEGVNAILCDMNMYGAALESHLPLGDLGDRLLITTRLSFAGTEHLVMLAGEIVNRETAATGSIYSERYGLRFDPMDDDTRVYLRGYLAESRLSYLGYEVDETE